MHNHSMTQVMPFLPHNVYSANVLHFVCMVVDTLGITKLQKPGFLKIENGCMSFTMSSSNFLSKFLFGKLVAETQKQNRSIIFCLDIDYKEYSNLSKMSTKIITSPCLTYQDKVFLPNMWEGLAEALFFCWEDVLLLLGHHVDGDFPNKWSLAVIFEQDYY